MFRIEAELHAEPFGEDSETLEAALAELRRLNEDSRSGFLFQTILLKTT
jgi:hypothetical protein